MDLTSHWAGIAVIVTFATAYVLVISEEFIHLRKSVPMILGAGIIWAIIAVQLTASGSSDAEEAVRHFMVEFGELSAVVDNIPVMVAVLQMMPSMDTTQWLLVTLTTGVGGSMLSVGSAAGVALMGQARGQYTFFTHLRWTPVILLGYLISIWVHLTINARYDGISTGLG